MNHLPLQVRGVALATLALLSCAGLVSCGNPAGGKTASAQVYVPHQIANGSPARVARKTELESPIEDYVSYWDGEGVKGRPKIVIDVSDQKAYFYKDDLLVGVSKVSSGRDGYDTPLGSYKILQKNRDHESSLYGDYVYPDGTIAVKEVDTTKDPKPPGTIYDGADMPYFMRFHRGVGLHAGYLPGFAASHGCVRMPNHMAEVFFENISIGTPVIVQR